MQTQPPVIVRIIEPPVESTTVVDILVGSIGLTAVLVLTALVLGALLGGLLIGVKKFRERYNLEPVPDSEALRVTPAPHL
jgi:membrane protein CcdC involved in cytochrome C biogenesis